jgi:hypothetical protein
MRRSYLAALACLLAGTSLAGDAEPVAPRRPNIPELEGAWRLLLPAGFEQRVTLVRVEGDCYRLAPGGLTMSGLYRLRRDRLVKSESDPTRPPGRDDGDFAWTIRSPYMIRMTDQPSGLGSDYSGAILFRSNDRLGAGVARGPVRSSPR